MSTSVEGSEQNPTAAAAVGDVKVSMTKNSATSPDNRKKPPPIGSTTSTTTTNTKNTTNRTGGGGGLSELSKQLRVLQAKNESQSYEIDRLERQLRILAELQGISVTEIRSALQNACESEAYGELQHRVGSLRAQLEAVSLAKEQKHSSALTHEVSTLQLRIGELEEIDEKQKREIKSLYNQLLDAKEMISDVEGQLATNDLITKDLESQLSIAKLASMPVVVEDAEQEELDGEQKNVNSSSDSSDFAEATELHEEKKQTEEPYDDNGEAEREISMLKLQLSLIEQKYNDSTRDNGIYKEKIHGMESKYQGVQRENMLLKEKLTLTEQQLASNEEESKLRNAQHKARYVVQNERINDLEQQLSSLYVAFHMLQTERNEEVQERDLLKHSLDAADTQVARMQQVANNSNVSQSMNIRTGTATTTESTTADNNANTISSSTPIYSRDVIHSTSTPHSQSIASPTADGGPSMTSPMSPLSPPPVFAVGEPIHSGILLIRTTAALGIKKWKKRNAMILWTGSHYQLLLGKGNDSYALTKENSRIEPYTKHNYGFIIRTNVFDGHAPVLYAAAEDNRMFQKWMIAFSVAATGINIQHKNNNNNADFLVPISPLQEAADLARALEESTKDISASNSYPDDFVDIADIPDDSDYDNSYTKNQHKQQQQRHQQQQEQQHLQEVQEQEMKVPYDEDNNNDADDGSSIDGSCYVDEEKLVSTKHTSHVSGIDHNQQHVKTKTDVSSKHSSVLL